MSELSICNKMMRSIFNKYIYIEECYKNIWKVLKYASKLYFQSSYFAYQYIPIFFHFAIVFHFILFKLLYTGSWRKKKEKVIVQYKKSKRNCCSKRRRVSLFSWRGMYSNIGIRNLRKGVQGKKLLIWFFLCLCE